MNMIRKENICIVDNIQDKKECFHGLASFLAERGEIKAEEVSVLEQGLWEREKISLTGIGNGVAIPHVQSKVIKHPIVICLKSKHPIHYESLEGDQVSLVFMIAVPENAGQEHLEYLAKLSRKLVDEVFVERLKKEDTVLGLYEILKDLNLQKKETGKLWMRRNLL